MPEHHSATNHMEQNCERACQQHMYSYTPSLETTNTEFSSFIVQQLKKIETTGYSLGRHKNGFTVF